MCNHIRHYLDEVVAQNKIVDDEELEVSWVVIPLDIRINNY